MDSLTVDFKKKARISSRKKKIPNSSIVNAFKLDPVYQQLFSKLSLS